MPQPPAAAPATSTFTVSRKEFDSIPRRRAFYIVSYGLVMLLVYGPKVMAMGGILLPAPVVYSCYAIGVSGYFFFCYHFIGTLKIMGYELWMILALAMIAAIPLPGVLIIAYIDRRVATAWDKADPSRKSYRQKPSSYE
jgi:hypothetical protein